MQTGEQTEIEKQRRRRRKRRERQRNRKGNGPNSGINIGRGNRIVEATGETSDYSLYAMRETLGSDECE